ncbi:MAG: hypothetical protein WAL94_13925 [Bacteroidales bacterium]|jgi:hypothetical protein
MIRVMSANRVPELAQGRDKNKIPAICILSFVKACIQNIIKFIGICGTKSTGCVFEKYSKQKNI